VTYQQICKQSTTTGASNGAGYGYPSRSTLVLSEVDWHQWWYSDYKSVDKSQIIKEQDCGYDNWNISMVICDTDFPLTLA
jgi:hypothetical protein